MRKTPIILAAFFIFVTLSRVSNYSAQMGDKTISVIFAIGLGSVIFCASYWTQYQGNTTPSDQEQTAIRKTVVFAWAVLVVSTVVDGIFNLADVLSENDFGFAPVVYGLTPTLLSLLLGILQARIDTIPALRRGSSYKLTRALNKTILDLLNRFQPVDQPEQEPKPEQEPEHQPVDQPEQEPKPEQEPEHQPVVIPVNYPENGSSRDQMRALLRVNSLEISGDKLGAVVGISGSRARALRRQILSENGKGVKHVG